MNTSYKAIIFACLTVSVLGSCVKEDILKTNPAADGSEIIFGARAGFEDSKPNTKTVYSGSIYTVGQKSFERIDWLDGTDKIEIYCPESINGHTSHYQVIDNGSTAGVQNDFASLSRVGDSSLQWNGDGVHHFYAMYPSSQMFDPQSTLAQGVKMDGTTLKGIVPASQAPVSITTDDNGNYVAEPDMKFAYMAAKSTATRAEGSVSLTFVPTVTAVKITMSLDGTSDPVTIGEIQLQGSGIAGAFTADLGAWDPNTNAYPDCTNAAGGADIIQISTWQEQTQGQFVPLTIAGGKTLTFTAFLRPGTDVSNLTVRISQTGASYISKTMSGLTIPKNLKTVISPLKLPANITIDASKWMSQLGDNTELKGLSLPGSGGSFTAGYTGSNPDYYKQQTLDFDQQWDMGIRAFEISCDRSTKPILGSQPSLANEYVTCNKQSVGVTVKTVLTDLLDKVKNNPTETAVLIITYQPVGSLFNPRNATYFAEALKKLYNELSAEQKGQIIQYTPSITLREARGNVMIFCRVNQTDEKDNGDFAGATNQLQNTNITLINGCGTAKDKWGARGYFINETRALNISNNATNNNYVEYYMIGPANGTHIDPYDDPNSNVKVQQENIGYVYETNYSDVKVWYQEWARVVFEPMTGSIGSTYYHWFPSYKEKMEDIKATFTAAISGSEEYRNTIFINTLSGYLTTMDFEDSRVPSVGDTWGGSGGDIKGLAAKVNPEFYNFILSSGMEEATGPTGIVIMDYISNDPNDGIPGSYYIPGVIIANNFKSGSGHSGSGSGNGNENPSGGGQEGGSGGSAGGI